MESSGILTAKTGFTQEDGTTTVSGSLHAIKKGVKIERGSAVLHGGEIAGEMILGQNAPMPVAFLRGFGTIADGLSVLAADVDPSGLLQIVGILALAPNAVLEVRIGANGLQGRVNVTGVADFNGLPDLRITLLGAFVPVANTRYTFLTFGKKNHNSFQVVGDGAAAFTLLVNKNSMVLVAK